MFLVLFSIDIYQNNQQWCYSQSSRSFSQTQMDRYGIIPQFSPRKMGSLQLYLWEMVFRSLQYFWAQLFIITIFRIINLINFNKQLHSMYYKYKYIINLSYYKLMGSPSKKKYQQGVQQEILTNYYLSKVDKYMSKLNDRKIETKFELERSLPTFAIENPKRRNFKQAILEKKGIRSKRHENQQNKQESGRKNFRQQIQLKHSQQKVKRQTIKNFYLLEDTIVNQLYKPSPSPLQKSKFSDIQIVHRVTYEQKVQAASSFRPILKQEQDNIQINQQHQQQQQIFQVQSQRYEHDKIFSAIKQSFEKRSPSRNKSRSNSRKQQKSPDNQEILIKIPQKKFPPKYHFHEPEQNQQSNQQSYYAENVRHNFQQIQHQRYNNKKHPHFSQENSQIYSKNQQKRNKGNFLQYQQQDKKSISSKKSRKSTQKNKNNFDFDRSPWEKEGEERKKNSSSHNDDSFHRSVPQIEQEPKISSKQKHDSSHLSSQPQNKQLKSSRIRAENEKNQNRERDRDREPLQDFSMISRFSMTSEEGTHIRDELQKQLNQNQFGPYQNALTNLLDLIGDYPNAWPIFVVGQRILQDRHQYENKRQNQQNQLSKMQSNIQKLKKPTKKKTQIEQNNLQILQLVRQLGELLQQSV